MPKLTSSCRIPWKVLLLGIFTSCAASKEVVVPLTTKASLPREMGQSFWTTNTFTPDSSTAAYARQLGLETYIVTQFLHRSWEQLYQKWKAGRADSATYAATLRRFMRDADSNSSLPPLDNESRFLFGRKKSGEYVVVADENNSNAFQDDSLRSVVPIIGKTRAVDPTPISIRITNLQGYDKDTVSIFSTVVSLQPTVASEAPRPANYDFYLNLITSESTIGQFRYKGKTYKVAMRNCGFPIYNDRPEFELLKFAAGKEDSAFLKRWNTRPEYRVGDTIALAKYVFLIKDASTLHASVTLQRLRMPARKVRPKGIDPRLEAIAANAKSEWKGKPYPSFLINGHSGMLSNETLKGKVVFVNFWFAACPPCIAEFDALSEMYNRLKGKTDFEFISFTFESPEVVAQVREKYQLTFPIYSISRQECERLNMRNGYPTSFIINKEGKIKYLQAGGETSKAAAKAFVEKEFYSRIVQEL